ncbi:hypothetical protein Amir_6054 [Actinosynnema mirum DSM 43827]|uniref:Uncharacterized protein n=2 Tax=Actinosynnema mirum TaxID=40567 RepID=C6WG97_ACTMD|nr:hypothetical protein Amir_6054 [Actinosynnema mirum DSM 43827]
MMTGAVAFVFGLCMLSFAAGCVLTAWMLRRAEDVEEEPAEADGDGPVEREGAAPEAGGRARAHPPSFPPDDFATRPIHRNPVVGVVGRWGSGGEDPWSDGGVDAAGPGDGGKPDAAGGDPWPDDGVDGAGGGDPADAEPRERPPTTPKPLMRLVDIADLLARERPELVAQPEPAEVGAGGAAPVDDQPADKEDAFASEEPAPVRPQARAGGLRVVPLHLLTDPGAYTAERDARDAERGAGDADRGAAGRDAGAAGRDAGAEKRGAGDADRVVGSGVEPEVAAEAGFADVDELSLEASYLVSRLSELGWAEEVARVVEEGRGRTPREPVELTATAPTPGDRPTTQRTTTDRATTDRATTDRATTEQSAADHPVADHPVADQLVAGRLTPDRPAAERHAVEDPVAEQPAPADQPSASDASDARSAAANPSSEAGAPGEEAAQTPEAEAVGSEEAGTGTDSAAAAGVSDGVPRVPGPRRAGRPEWAEVPAPRDEGASGELVAGPEVESPGAQDRGAPPVRSAEGLVAEPEPDLVDVLDLTDDPVDADEPEPSAGRAAAGQGPRPAEPDPVDALVEQRRSGDLADVEPELGVEVAGARADQEQDQGQGQPADGPAPSPVSSAEVPPQGGTVSDEPEEQVRRRG